MEPPNLKTPVLLLLSNRPAVAKIAFEVIRAIRPSRLYVVSDGPKGMNSDESAKCSEIRSVVGGIDWDGEVHTLFREEHFGYGKGISKGIDWFFDHENEGIILEDHCLPHPTFFRYCSELLNVYRSDTRVMEISGNNAFHSIEIVQDYSYGFSRFTHNGAWASWKRAWNLNDHEMKFYAMIRKENLLQYSSLFEKDYYDWVFERAYLFPDRSWQYQWDFAKKINNGLTIVPQKNLVALLEDEEILKEANDSPMGKCESLEFPMVHPLMMVPHTDRDNQIFIEQKTSLTTRLKTQVKSMSPQWLRNKMYRASIAQLIKSSVSIPDTIEILKSKSTY